MPDRNNFPHILTASSTLLGLCFIVLTTFKLSDNHETSMIDECTSVAILMFMIASILSYLSMRKATEPGKYYEKLADIVFLTGLGFLFLITVFITFNVIS
jgi:uncharacterized membrane protein (DUF485 family)